MELTAENVINEAGSAAKSPAFEPAQDSPYPPVIEREGCDGRGHFHAVSLRPNGKEPPIHIYTWADGYSRACIGDDISMVAEANTPLDAINLAIEKYQTKNNIS